jgi:hypothetical protein
MRAKIFGEGVFKGTRRPRCSHPPGWLQASRRSYKHEPFVVAAAAPDEEFKIGIVFFRVKSWPPGNGVGSLRAQPSVVGTLSM